MINTYFSELKSLLNTSLSIERYNIKKEIIVSFLGQIWFEINFKDNSVLHCFEHVVISRNRIVREKYRYHWMDKNGNLIRRWDNAPHHKDIETFPFHVHTKEDILPSDEIRLDQILQVIESML